MTDCCDNYSPYTTVNRQTGLRHVTCRSCGNFAVLVPDPHRAPAVLGGETSLKLFSPLFPPVEVGGTPNWLWLIASLGMLVWGGWICF